jgi:hypothetical protein
VYLDNLKVGLVAAIIAGHAVIGYAAIGSWPYQDVQEARLGSAAETAFTLMLGPPALFAMGLFFLLAGLLTPGSLARKGPDALSGTGCCAWEGPGRRQDQDAMQGSGLQILRNASPAGRSTPRNSSSGGRASPGTQPQHRSWRQGGKLRCSDG